MIKKLSTIIFLGLLCSNVFAASKNNLYQVDLIVFTHITPAALKSEHWPDQILQPNIKDTLELKKATDKTITSSSQNLIPDYYNILSASRLGLRREVRKLKNDSEYRIVLHQSWQQPIGNSYQSKWVHITGDLTYDAKGNLINKNNLTTSTICKAPSDKSLDNLLPKDPNVSIASPPDDCSVQLPIPKYWELNGKIKITKNRFFDIYTRLYLTEPEMVISGQEDTAPAGDFQPIPLRTFKLFNHRRTRLNQLNYLDHPLFGVLIKITRIK